MKEKEIVKLIERIFREEVWSSCAETVLGLESWIEGEDAFFERLEKMLNLILNSTYTKIENEKQYYEYCNILEEIDFSDEADKREDEIYLLSFLIEQWDEEQVSLLENNSTKEHFFLDLSDDLYWLIKSRSGERYVVGRNKQDAQELIKILNEEITRDPEASIDIVELIKNLK